MSTAVVFPGFGEQPLVSTMATSIFELMLESSGIESAVWNCHSPILTGYKVAVLPSEKCINTSEDVAQRETLSSLQSALPDVADAPAILQQLLANFDVTADVSTDLFSPELLLSFRPSEQMTVMAVPETAVDEDHGFAASEDQVGFAGELRVVEPITPTERVQSPSDEQLRLCVSAPDRCHVAAA
jgi:hypothetical protein